MTENRQDGRLGDLSSSKTTPETGGLNPRQLRFAQEYLADPNGKQAAIRAGYSKNGAEVTASKLLRVPKVAAYLAKEQEKLAKELHIDAAWVLRGLRRVALRCMQRVPVMVRGERRGELVQKTDDKGEGVWEFDSAGANRALELLGKHLKLFTDKVEASGPGGLPLEILIRDLGHPDNPAKE